MQDEGEVLKVLKEICYELRVANRLKAMEVSLIPFPTTESYVGLAASIPWVVGIANSIILPNI